MARFQWLTGSATVVLMWVVSACSGVSVSTSNEQPLQESQSESQSSETVSQVVALTSLTADIIHTLDDQALIGISGSSVLAKDPRFNELDVVSEGRTEPDLEKIVALKPDLVIGAKGFHDKTLNRLKEINVPVMSVEVDSWDALKTLTQDLAQRLKADPEPLTQRYDTCLGKASNRTPSALVLVSRQPLLSPNQESWAGDFLKQFKIQNMTAEFQGDSPIEGYITLSEEKLLTTNPEALIVVETGRENLLEQLQGDPFWSKLQATQRQNVFTFEYFGLVNPGSIASIEATCENLSKINLDES